MLVLTYAILFILGLGLGSFFNVVSLRYQPDKPLDLNSLNGRSKCPHCGKTLSWLELIPFVSFIIQRGRCRKCGNRLSLQYPIVELLGGLTLMSVPWYLNQFYQAPYLFLNSFPLSWYYIFAALWALSFLALLVISAIDFRHYVIPNGLVAALLVFGSGIVVLKNFYLNQLSLSLPSSFLRHYGLVFSWTQNVWLNHLAAALFAGGVFALIVYLSKEKAMGWGDVKLAAALGWLLGSPDIIFALAASFLIGGLTSLGLIILNKKTLKSHIPFGPFLALGSATVFFFGSRLMEFYFSLFSK